MTRGRKPANPKAKELAGTFRKDRHGSVVELAVVPKEQPAPPAWLTEGARAVWDIELRRLVATGAAEADTSMLALYCETLATFIAAVRAGETPTAAFRAELRKQMELLGVAGAKSRLTRMTAPSEAKTSPFTARKPA